MKNRMTHLTVAAAVLAACYVLGTVLATPVWAQVVRAALIRDIDHPARHAVTIRRSTLGGNSFEAVYTVPADKTLVIEHVNCTAIDTDAQGFVQEAYVGIQGGLGFDSIVYSVPAVATKTILTWRIFDGQTRLYFEPGTEVLLRIINNYETTCTISGFTVNQL